MLFNPDKKIPILSIGRSTLSFGWVSLSGKPSWKQVVTTPYTESSLTAELLNIKKTAGIENLRLLLEKNCYYLLTLSVPKSLQPTKEQIAAVLRTEIPEEYDNAEWDYKEIKSSKETHQKFIVFAPVKSVWDLVVQSCHEAECELNVVEAEELACLRHEDPHIGLALKSDVRGDDERALNVSVHRPRPFPKLSVLFSLIFLLVLGLIGAVMVARMDRHQTVTQRDSLKAQADLKDSATPSNSLTASTEIINPSLVRIQLLNGAGESDVVASVEKQLSSEGFTIVQSGVTLQATGSGEIRRKQRVSEDVMQRIMMIIRDQDLIVTEMSPLSDTADNDIVIIIR